MVNGGHLSLLPDWIHSCGDDCLHNDAFLNQKRAECLAVGPAMGTSICQGFPAFGKFARSFLTCFSTSIPIERKWLSLTIACAFLDTHNKY